MCMKDVVAVMPHVVFSDESRSKPDSPMMAKVVSCPIVREYVPANDWRGLHKDNIPLWDKFRQVRHYFVL